MALAYFLGCDYTDGVTGVGIVNALEIVQAFPMRSQDESDSADNDNSQADSVTATNTASPSNQVSGYYPIVGLKKFREWLEGYDFRETVMAQKAKKTNAASKSKIEVAGTRKGNSNIKRLRRHKIKRKRKDDGGSNSDDSASQSDLVGDSEDSGSSGTESEGDVLNNSPKVNSTGTGLHDDAQDSDIKNSQFTPDLATRLVSQLSRCFNFLFSIVLCN